MGQPHEPEYWLPTFRALTEAECRELAAGQVPEWLRDCCRSMVEFSLQTGPLDYVGMASRRQARTRKVAQRDAAVREAT